MFSASRFSAFSSYAFPLLLTLVLSAPLSRASHYEVLSEGNKAPIQCLVQDLRHPQWTSGHYLACYSQYFGTKEGYGGYFYGGFVAHPGESENLLQFCSWQMSGKGAPAADIDFAWAGRHMSWAKTTWEGSAGGIKGMWPKEEFKENEWHRFVARTWSGPEDPKHSCVGIWMKDLPTGLWTHLATTRYPGEINNLNHFYGFQENFSGGNADAVAHLDIRNTYSLRDGQWVADNKVLFRAQGEGDNKERLRLKTIEGGKAVSLATMWPNSKKITGKERDDADFQPKNQELTYSPPAAPDFLEATRITSLGAACTGAQLLVKWEIAPDSCPQLSWKIEVYATADHKDPPVQVLSGNDPERRSLLLDAPFSAMPSIRLILTDIYGNPAPAMERVAVLLKPQPAANLTAAAPGLNYRYFEAADKLVWNALPDFTKLSPVRQGAASMPDLSLRLRRENYAFEFTGQIEAPAAGIYNFTAVFASGLKLSIDGQPVIDGDGYRSIGSLSGAVPLAAGKHALRLQYVQGARQLQQMDDFLQLLWAVPGASGKAVRIPAEAFSRQAEMGEPKLVLKAPAGGGNAVKLAASVASSGVSPESIQYFIQAPDFDYFRAQGAQGGDFYIGAVKNGNAPLEALLWGSPAKTVRARLLYGKNRTIDSSPVTFQTSPDNHEGWTLTELEHHQYPVSAQVQGSNITMVGESMALLTKSMTGDGVLTARLADITADGKAPDGSEPAGGVWQAGIILRNDLGASPGEPLGGNTTYAALLGCVDGSIRDCDSLMKNGAGNQPSGDRGRAKRWMKLERKGKEITEFLSEDGRTWTQNKVVALPKLADSLHAGLFLYALPSATPLLHHATFDNVTLTPGAAQ